MLSAAAAVAVLFPAAVLFAQTEAQIGEHPHPHHRDMSADEQHFEHVNRQGDAAMGFSHLKTTHHFRLTPTGGVIDVQANDPRDEASREQVQTHLQHITKAFKAGDFAAPFATHGRVPPGVPVMQRLKGEIEYKYQETASGAKVLIETKNAEALKAVHEFLRFQIQDHRTGNSQDVSK